MVLDKPTCLSANEQGDADLVFDNFDIKPHEVNLAVEQEDHDNSGWISKGLHRIKRQLYNFFGSATEAPKEENNAIDTDDYLHYNPYTDDEDIIQASGDGSGDAEPDLSPVWIRITINVHEIFSFSLEDHTSEEFRKLDKALASSIEDLYHDLPGTRRVELVSAQPGFDAFYTKVTLDVKSENYKNVDVLKERLHNRIVQNRRLGEDVVSLEGFTFTKFDGHITTCNADEIPCDTGGCIPVKAKCDGTPQCPDHSDEAGCAPKVHPTTASSYSVDVEVGPEEDDKTTPIPTTTPPTITSTTTTTTTAVPTTTTTGSTTSTSTTMQTSTTPAMCRTDNIFRCGTSSIFICEEQECDGVENCPDGEDELNCSEENLHECAQGEFICDITRCIPIQSTCDGKQDCTDGTDERGCKAQHCGPNEFKCNDGHCIDIRRQCDNYPDCRDGEDEEQCPKHCDSQKEFECGDGVCIPIEWRCNRNYDCKDISDEKNCPCKEDDFHCKSNGICIPKWQRCDNIVQCADQSDEYGCPKKPTCEDYQWQCKDGTCIDAIKKCDLTHDCPDNSDEQNCTCKNDEFRCNLGLCISISKRCDGVGDCPFSEDEESCGWEVLPKSKFPMKKLWKCPGTGNITFILERQRCDGYDDCGDNNDEEDCEKPAYRPGIDDGAIECGPNEIRCDGEEDICAKRCDNIIECDYGEDEQNCNSTCSLSQFKCADSDMCIDEEKRCDDYPDCPDGSDERDCAGCPYGYFRCRTGICLFDTVVCDGRPDCPDQSDERNCSSTCRHDEFTCGDGQCILHYLRCDGAPDCNDRSDERNCPFDTTTTPSPTPSRVHCSYGELQCKDGKSCYKSNQHCDGHYDCDDRSDEESCPSKTCASNEFQCSSSETCIPSMWRCDSVNDCPHGEDEQYCAVTTCSHSQFRCDDGTCIQTTWVCDGDADCNDNSDERGCDVTCRDDEFQCKSTKKCIPKIRRCDRKNDCENGEDEENCLNTTCHSSEFRCNDGYCIQNRLRCDGRPDCTDSSDEINCGTCAELEFRCSDGSCVPLNLRCDNLYDCRDFSDEQNCFACQDDEFACGDGQCIPKYMRCDNRQDCSDNSDEINCKPVPTTNPEVEFICPRGSRICGDRSCYRAEQHCDGRYDCPDGTDEQFCSRPTEAPQLNLRTYPSSQDIKESTFKLGREVVFQCRDEGPVRARVHWIRANGQPLPPGSRDVKGRLEIPDIQLSHSGTYTCEAVGVALGTPGSQVQVQLKVEPLISAPPPPQHIACQLHEATCSNGDCIRKEQVCDGKYDCKDGSDETRCSKYTCEPNEFRCTNKQCVLKTWLCDGENDCFDGSDELNCDPPIPGQACTNKQFVCRSGQQCIPKSFHCDHQNDCQDGSDEYGCSHVVIRRPPPPKVELEVGSNFEITCTAVGVPTPEIIWRLNWGHIPEKCRTRSVNGTGTLTCPDIQEHDQGAYSCEAINSFGPIFAVPDTILTVFKETDVCPAGFFNDDARREDDCISCFCFGITTNCRSADLFIYQFSPPLVSFQTLGVHVDRATGQVQVDRDPRRGSPRWELAPTLLNTGVRLYHTPAQGEDTSIPYFVMPENYNRNQLKSYGGYLRYNVSYNGYGRPTSKAPDAIIIGNGYTLIHPSRQHQDRADHHRNINYEIRFFPGDWFMRNQYGQDIPAKREEIMMVLANIDYILIKLQYVEGHIDSTLDNIGMDSAGPTGLTDAVFVEECRCPVGYSGLSCELCAPGYARHESGPWLGKCYKIETCAPGEYGDPGRSIQCRPCPCPHTGPSNQFGRTCTLQSDGEVTCDCPPGYTGRRCEQCASGFSGNPLIPGDSCKPSHCNPDGTVEIEPDGRCRCKEFTTGPSCNQCQKNSFHLSSDNQFGCIPCFCMGITQQCSSSNWYRDMIQTVFTSSKNDFKIVDSRSKERPSDHGIQLHQDSREIVYNNFTSSPDVKYWFLPTRYLGNKVTAYGGKLRYSLRYNPLPGGQSSRNTYPDVELISKNQIKLSYYHKQPIQANSIQTISVPLLEQYWQRNDGEKTYREHLLMALAELEAILIKATYTTNTREVALQSVSLDIADSRNTGLQRAFEVEQCHCPESYRGLSCEHCAYGYKRTTDGLYLGLCESCTCNGYSNECDPETGDCINCRNHTTGPECDRCAAGYVGDPINRIPCRYDEQQQNCICDPRGSVSQHCYGGSCQCKINVEGQTCNRCKEGTFGLSSDISDGCQSCFCSGVSTACSESNLYIEQIPSQILDPTSNNDFTLTDRNMQKTISEGFQANLALNEMGYIFRPSETDRLFWSLPNTFTGNKIKSYGGKLEFTQRYTQRPNAKLFQDYDVIINGNGITIGWSAPTAQQVDIANKISVTLSPAAKWQRQDRQGPRPASREDILRVLANIDSILIRAQPTTDTSSTFISDITLDTAVEISTGQDKAISVEECRCPAGYKGTSCEVCDKGYYRDSSDSSIGPLGSCLRCPCSNNEENCQLGYDSRVQCNCLPGYFGHDCGSPVDLPSGQPPPYTNHTPSIIVTIKEPQLQIVSIGDTVTYYCEARAPHAVRIPRISWGRDGGQLPDRAIDDSRGSLIITDVRISDSGRYICQATDGYSIATQYVTLTVGGNEPTHPSSYIQPETLEVREEEPFQLMCQVRGIPHPNIHWERIDQIPLNPQHSISDGVLYVERTRVSDSGQYKCIASNIAGTHESYATVIVRQNIEHVVEPEINPPSYTGPERQPFTLNCEIREPYNSVTWSKAPGDLPYSSRKQHGMLAVDDPSRQDSGTYTCTIATYTGRTTSKSATVTITSPHGVPASVRVSPSNQTVGQGTTVEMHCNVSGSPTPQVKWTRVHEQLGHNAKQYGNTLRLSNVDVSDRGIYICVANNEFGVAQESSLLEVSRRTPPIIEIHPKTTQNVQEGGSAFLQCRVLQGDPYPNITWSRPRHGEPLGRNVEQLPGGVLRFNRVITSDSGEYICTASNDAGLVTATATIQVTVIPTITLSPQRGQNDYTVKQGDPIRIECRSTGIPTPNIQWTKMEHARISGSLGVVHISDAAVLQIHQVSNHDAGTYVCTANNSAGFTEQRISLSVYPSRGDITGNGSDTKGEDSGVDSENVIPKSNEIYPDALDNVFTAFVGTEAELRCRLENVPFPVRSKWVRVDGRQLPEGHRTTETSLIIRDVQPSDAGEYRCITTDFDGNHIFNQTARLRVFAAPRIVLEPPSQTVRPGERVGITCRVTGDEPIDIQWRPVNRNTPIGMFISGPYMEFLAIKVSDAGRYRCTARNMAGEADAVAEIIVNEAEQRPQEGHDQTALEGGSVSLSCVVGTSSPYRTIEWYREHQPLPDNSEQRGNDLEIWSLTPDDAGRYYCVVHYQDGSSSSNYTNLHVAYEARGPSNPELIIQSNNPNPKEGDNMDLHCRSTEPGVITTWSKVNNRLEDNIQTSGATIRFFNLKPANSGTYRCEARGYSAPYSKDYVVNVADTYKETKAPMDIKSAPQGAIVYMDCKVDLQGPITYQWAKQSEELPRYVDKYSKTIVLKDLTSNDAGTYICTATDGRISRTIPTVLVVTGIVPYFTQAPNSYISLPTIPDHYSSFNFEISFKPETDYGLILYNGDKTGDYMSLTIGDGLITFRLSLGKGVNIIITSADPVESRQWHTVAVDRNRKSAVMYVDGKGPYTGTAHGSFSGLTLRDPLYLGGVPDYSALPADVEVRTGFVGCVSQFKVGSTYYDILREAHNKVGTTNCETCQENPCRNDGVCQESLSKKGFTCICPQGYSGSTCQKMAEQSCAPYMCGVGKCVDNDYSYECHCPIGRAGKRCEREIFVQEPAFSRNAYLAYPPMKLPSRQYKINLKVKPRDLADGILMYSAERNEGYGDFISIALKDQQIEFKFGNTESGVTILRSNKQIIPDDWVDIIAIRSLREGRLHVNGATDTKRLTGASTKQLNLNTPLFLGGVNKAEVTVNNQVGVIDGFNGCVSEFTVAGMDLDILKSSQEGANILDCSVENTAESNKIDYSHESLGCDSNPCRNDGICYPVTKTTFKCACVNGYTGVTCEQAPNLCEQLKPCQNGGTCRGSTVDYECTCPIGYYGTNCEQRQEIRTEAHFDGNGYLEFDRAFLPHDNEDEDELIAVQFMTNSSNGVIFWHGQTPEEDGHDQDFIGLAIVDGYLEYSYNLGGGPFAIVNKQIRVDDERLHTVFLKRHGVSGSIEIDNLYLERGSSPGLATQLNTAGNIYLGGTPNIPLMTGKYHQGFSGCILQFEIQNSKGIDLGKYAISGINVKPCPSGKENDDELVN